MREDAFETPTLRHLKRRRLCAAVAKHFPNASPGKVKKLSVRILCVYNDECDRLISPPITYETSKDAARYRRIGKHLEKIASEIDNLDHAGSELLIAVNKLFFLKFFETKIGKSRPMVFSKFASTTLLKELSAVADSYAENLELREKKTIEATSWRPPKTKRGRPALTIPSAVSYETAGVYWRLTGKIPRMNYDGILEQPCGAFYMLLEDVFLALSLTQSVEHYAKTACKEFNPDWLELSPYAEVWIP